MLLAPRPWRTRNRAADSYLSSSDPRLHQNVLTQAALLSSALSEHLPPSRRGATQSVPCHKYGLESGSVVADLSQQCRSTDIARPGTCFSRSTSSRKGSPPLRFTSIALSRLRSR